MDFLDELAALQDELGVSNRRLAFLTGVHRSTIVRWRQKKHVPYGETVNKIYRELHKLKREKEHGEAEEEGTQGQKGNEESHTQYSEPESAERGGQGEASAGQQAKGP